MNKRETQRKRQTMDKRGTRAAFFLHVKPMNYKSLYINAKQFAGHMVGLWTDFLQC